MTDWKAIGASILTLGSGVVALGSLFALLFLTYHR